ncbi:unnamed protein product [Urochloa humidicola]
MAVLRSALAMLSRGSSGSPAAAHMGGRGIFHRAAPPLRPPAIGNAEGCRRFSTGKREPADKAESGLRMWWQRARDRMENASLEERDRMFFAYSLFVLGLPAVYVLKSTSFILRS